MGPFLSGVGAENETPSEDSDEGVVILMVDKARSNNPTTDDCDDLEGTVNEIETKLNFILLDLICFKQVF